jgi:hypothetical protein
MNVISVFAILLVLILMILGFGWHFARAAAILQQWADENGYEILERSYCHFFRGPFFFRTTKDQVVYRVTVRDKAGNVGTGWVACGSWWLGLWSNQAKVSWDQAPQATAAPMRDRWLDG